MNELKFYNIFVSWTRSIVLILSVVVVVISLSIYSYNYTPAGLEDTDKYTTHQVQKLIYDMIQDRKLIATLVAAQASIFCPLFLLMSSSNMVLHLGSVGNVSNMDIWRAGVEQFCQFLMPLGLMFSWIFCITFDKRMETTLLEEYSANALFSTLTTWDRMCLYIADSLKYFIIIALIMEVLTIWVASFKYVSLLYISKNQCSIRLPIDEDDVEYGVVVNHYSSMAEKSVQGTDVQVA